MTQRHRTWADRRVNAVVAVGGGGTIIENLLLNAPTLDTITVVRLVGYLECVQSSLNESEYTQSIDIGIGVSSVDAFNVGVSALPSPTVETEYPPRGWLYAGQRTVMQTQTPTGMVRNLPIFEFDLRAMRKIDKGVLFLVIRNEDIDGTTSSIRVIGRVRALCLT